MARESISTLQLQQCYRTPIPKSSSRLEIRIIAFTFCVFRGSSTGASDRLNSLDLVRLQSKIGIENGKIRLHVAGAGRPGQGQHPNVECESKDNLSNGSAMTPGHRCHFRSSDHFAIGRQQRETLIDDSVGRAEIADVAIPLGDGVAAILDEHWPYSRLLEKA